MNLWKKLFNAELTGKTEVPSKSSLDIKDGGLFKIAGTTVTSSAAELNIVDGVLATAAEINRAADASARVVAVSATTLAVTEAAHDGKVIVLALAAAQAVTLPAATGSGSKFTFVIKATTTSGNYTIKVANTYDVLAGVTLVSTTTATNAEAFATTATDDTITLNGTTQGGFFGDRIEIIDVATSIFQVSMWVRATGTEATPFSASV